MLDELQIRVHAIALESARLGLIRGTSGNISARDPETGLVVITPSGIPYEALSPNDLPVVNLDGHLVRGNLKPSSETHLHMAVYRARTDVNGIAHTHSVYGTVFSVLNREIPTVTVPLALYGPVSVAPFRIPGSLELAEEVVTHLSKARKAILLQNHGVLCVGVTVEEALNCAAYVEEGAQVAYLAMAVGTFTSISPEHAEMMKEKAGRGEAL
jgi:L-ribulose-5-phosphate 4-epimerase